MLPEEATTEFRYDHKSGDILSGEKTIVATISGNYRMRDRSLGHKMAAGPKLVDALKLLYLSHQQNSGNAEGNMTFLETLEMECLVEVALAKASGQ